MEEANEIAGDNITKTLAGVHDEITNLQIIVREGLAKWRSDLIKWLFISSITQVIMFLILVLLLRK